MKRIIATAALFVGLLAFDGGFNAAKSQLPKPELEAKILNKGRAIGWIQALCALTNAGVLKTKTSTSLISDMMDRWATRPSKPNLGGGKKYATIIGLLVTTKNPDCQPLIPKKYLLSSQ
ncbi:hypothetical protein [Synechococcus sp. MIT S9507]|uniref:hypothetical protein n=1 Tax=Synechococcus sp. MIT S9507 TaxID=3082544 RepID=UPI0039B48588